MQIIYKIIRLLLSPISKLDWYLLNKIINHEIDNQKI